VRSEADVATVGNSLYILKRIMDNELLKQRLVITGDSKKLKQFHLE
jgi:hypothetical protein